MVDAPFSLKQVQVSILTTGTKFKLSISYLVLISVSLLLAVLHAALQTTTAHLLSPFDS